MLETTYSWTVSLSLHHMFRDEIYIWIDWCRKNVIKNNWVYEMEGYLTVNFRFVEPEDATMFALRFK